MQNQFLDISDEAISELGDQMDANKFEFGNFCQVASRFMLEEDEEGMREELKEAFRSGILPSSRTKAPTHLFLVVPLGPKKKFLTQSWLDSYLLLQCIDGISSFAYPTLDTIS